MGLKYTKNLKYIKEYVYLLVIFNHLHLVDLLFQIIIHLWIPYMINQLEDKRTPHMYRINGCDYVAYKKYNKYKLSISLHQKCQKKSSQLSLFYN